MDNESGELMGEDEERRWSVETFNIIMSCSHLT